MRLDRRLTLIRGRLPWRSAGGRVLAILMYHDISERSENGVRPYFRVATHPGRFREQLRLLTQMRVPVVSLSDGMDWLRDEADATEELRVAITFDDALFSVYEVAWPMLREEGMTATVFVPTSFVSESRGSFGGQSAMTWGEIREMAASGIRFGSHTVNHPVLHDCSTPNVARELRDSRRALEDRLGLEVREFAYPFAFPQADRRFVSRFLQEFGEAGYRIGVTTRIGRARRHDDWRILPRLPVNDLDDAALFRAKLQGDYDWLRAIQWSVQRAKLFKRKATRSNRA